MHQFPQFNHIKPTRYGNIMYNHFDQYVGQSIELYGEFSEGEAELFAQLLKPGNVALDIGANIGAHTVQMARLVGPTGAVIAFEPQRVVFQTLCANMALNSIVNAYCQCAAVGEKPGAITVPQLDYSKGGNYGGLALGQYQRGEQVPVVTIDAMNLPACTLMKVDVEGMEINALQGAAATIARHHPFLYVENDRKEKSAALIAYIASLNYRMYWHYPPLYNIVSINMLCVPAALNIQLDPAFQPVKF
jgi:FkbM family methyltransferase